MPMRSWLTALVLPLALAACGGAEPVWAPDAEVSRAAYRSEKPPSVTLLTVVSTSNGSGAHSGLIVNGSQRVIFDPAGTFRHPGMPERNDVHYGLTDQRLEVYIDYHSRVTYDVITQEIPVSPEIAELLLNKVQSHGAVAKARCTQATSGILRSVPGFESLPQTWYPVKLQEAVARLPGVVTRTIHDDDADDNRYVLYTHTE
jgi:predicted small lipoprotein YifL